MGRKRSKNSTFGPDDHDQPTEPMRPLAFPVQANSTYRINGSLPDTWVAPAPPLETSFWSHNLPAISPYQNQGRAYPLLQPVHRSARPRKRRRSALPGLVGWFFVLVQLALLGRVVCMLLGIAATKPWIDLLFAMTDLFVWPIRWLANNINLSLPVGTQALIYLEFLLTILAYGLFSWFLVRIFKALLNG